MDDFPCIICGAPHAAITGLWELSPEMERKTNTPVNKRRTIMYHLCGSCYADAEVEQVEAKILLQITATPTTHVNIGSDPIYQHELN